MTTNSFYIGSLQISPPLFQAPMAGFTNDAFRRVLQKFGGVGLYATEMIHARGLLEMSARRKENHERLFGIPLQETAAGNVAQRSDRIAVETGSEVLSGHCAGASFPAVAPLAIQLWDNDADRLAAVTEKLLAEYSVSVIDLNFGCPEHDVVYKAHCGSWLLQFPEKIEKIVRAVTAAAGGTPVTAKIRLGLRTEDYSAPEVVQAAEAGGASAITVHGRTAEQMYSGVADWEKIADLKRFLRKIPLIGNGNIATPEDAVRAFRDYHVDGVMIGRAALGAPWLFRQTAALLRGELVSAPGLPEMEAVLKSHFAFLLAQYSPADAVIRMRKFAPRYGAGLRNARLFRLRVANMVTPEDFYEAVEEFFAENPGNAGAPPANF